MGIYRFIRRERATELDPWVGDLYVREMTALEAISFADGFESDKGQLRPQIDRLARAAWLFVIDKDGNNVFPDISAALATPVAFLQTAFLAVARFNKLDLAGQEDVEKNSDRARSEPSPNGSVSTADVST